MLINWVGKSIGILLLLAIGPCGDGPFELYYEDTNQKHTEIDYPCANIKVKITTRWLSDGLAVKLTIKPGSQIIINKEKLGVKLNSENLTLNFVESPTVIDTINDKTKYLIFCEYGETFDARNPKLELKPGDKVFLWGEKVFQCNNNYYDLDNLMFELETHR